MPRNPGNKTSAARKFGSFQTHPRTNLRPLPKIVNLQVQSGEPEAAAANQHGGVVFPCETREMSLVGIRGVSFFGESLKSPAFGLADISCHFSGARKGD